MSYKVGLNKNESLFWIANLLSTVICVLSCLYNRDVGVFKNVYILPIGYGIIFILFTANVKGIFDNYMKLIVYILYFVKDVFAIWILSLGGYNTLFNRISEDGVNFAIALMIYEFLCISLYFYFRRKISKKVRRYRFTGIKHTGNMILYVILFFCIIAYLLIPSIRDSYRSILDISNVINLSGDNSNAVGTISRIAHTLFVMFFQTTLLLFISVLFSRVRRIYGETNKGLVLCCIFLIIPTLFIPEETGFFLVLMVTLVLTICRLFPSKRKKNN